MDRRMLAAIGHHIDRYGSCFFNQTTLAEKMNVARRSVNRSIARLEELGYITKRDINDGREPKRPTSICRYELIFDEKDMEESNDGLRQDGPSAETQRSQLAETHVSLLNTPLRTHPLEHTPTCATRAAPEIALASTDAGDWREDSIFPAGPFIRVRSMTAAERAEPLNVIRRSEVSAAEWERLTHPREYVDEYGIDPGVDDDLIAAPIGNPEHQTNLSYMAFPEPFVTGPRIELETSDSEFAASVGEAIRKGLKAALRLSTEPVDNPERQSESILMAFPEPFVKKTRIGETTTIAPTTKPDLESKAAEKKETQQQPTATPEGTPAVVICKEGVQMEEFTLTAISPAKPKANRKRKTAATNDAFDIFWAAYPRKQDKQPAKKIWARLSQTDREAAIAAIPNYKLAHLGREQYLRMGSTYLSKATWEGYLPEPAASDATVAQTQETQTAPQSKHAARNALGAKKHPGDPYFGFGAQKLESLLNYRATGFWVGGNPNSQYDWWEGEEFEPELVALAKRVELGEVLFDDAMNSVRPVAKPLPQQPARPLLRVVR